MPTEKTIKGIGKGNHPNSIETGKKNMRPFKSGEDRAKELGRKGAIASAEARKANKTFQEALKEVMTDEDRLKIMGVLLKRAEQGNLKAMELAVDISGEKTSHLIDRERLELERKRLAMDEKKSEKDTAVVVRFEGMEELTD